MNSRITVLQTVALDHLATPPKKRTGIVTEKRGLASEKESVAAYCGCLCAAAMSSI